jgi:predicted RNA-binding protein associated with RNAse of E/G family
VRLHPVGRAYAVIRTWLADESRYAGWYVNLEQPWSRTTIGFDSRDDVLDVLVSDDLTRVDLKDEDELAFAIEVGVLTTAEGSEIRSNADQAISDIEHRRWPFADAAWAGLRPSLDDSPPELPEGWEQA